MASILKWTLIAHPHAADEKLVRLLWSHVAETAAITSTPRGVRFGGNELNPLENSIGVKN